MRATRALLLVASLAIAVAARAEDGPNPPGRIVLDPFGSRVPSAARPASPTAAQSTNALPVGLPAGAVQLDSTYYDLQDFGSLGHRIEVGADGRVHVTWQDDFCDVAGTCPPNLSAPQPYPQRGMGYAYRDVSGTWHHLGKVTDPDVSALHCCTAPEEFGGFGNLVLTPAGRAVVAQHINEESCDERSNFFLEDAAGGSTWTDYLPPIAGGSSFLFPQVAGTPSGGYSLLGEVPNGGVYDEPLQIATSWFPTTGTPYTCFNWQGQDWVNPAPSSLFRTGRPAYPCIAASSNGRVGIAVGDFGGNVYLIESSNGTFAPATVTIRNLTGYTDAQVVKTDSTSTQYRAYIHCHLAYRDTTPNVVWSELQARKSGTTLVFFDYHSRIRHWSPDRGLETVYQVPAGVADHYDDIRNGLNGPLAGFNTISVDWPQVGFSGDGSETYVAWLRYTDAEVDPTAIPAGLEGICTGIGYGDIACSVTRTAQAWSAPQDVTNTPRTDERFFSLATNNGAGQLHLVFQASATDQAGCAQIGDRGSTPVNIVRRIAYLEVRPAASVLAVPPPSARIAPSLRVSPNPAFGAARIRFASALAAAANRRVEVYSLDGRRVASLPLPQGGSAEWDARDTGGRRVPAGVYFARLSDEVQNTAVRFVLAR